MEEGDWRLTYTFAAVISLSVFTVIFFWIQESARWLFLSDRSEEAFEALEEMIR